MTGQLIATFRASCNACARGFDTPVLSDFQHGEFVARGERGGSNVYMNSLEAPWDEVWAIVERIVGPAADRRRVQEAVSACIDPVGGERFLLDSGPICPHCGSHDVRYPGERAGVTQLQLATFDAFQAAALCEEKEAVIMGVVSALNGG